MANSEQSSKLASNEEIIADITKDLSDSLTLGDPASASNEISSENAEIAKEPEEPEENIDGIPDDFIDEDALKNLESTLSEEEKTERHKKALDLKNQGNNEFKNSEYLNSIESYTEGLRICPLTFTTDRSILYANRGASKAKLDRKVSAIEDCTKAIEFNDQYIKAYLRRAKLYEDTEKLDESLGDYKKVSELDPGNNEARAALTRLPPLINERNEKLKTEMLGKLKDLGNLILKPFGLSTENFQLNQDPNSGSYSVNFKQSQS